jgi:hypothetical protein
MYPASMDESAIPFFGSWNAQRSVVGEKPTFEHKCWLCVGRLLLPWQCMVAKNET